MTDFVNAFSKSIEMDHDDLSVPERAEEEHRMRTPDLEPLRLEIALGDLRDRIDNRGTTLSAHLELEDPSLIVALESLSKQAHRRIFRALAFSL